MEFSVCRFLGEKLFVLSVACVRLRDTYVLMWVFICVYAYITYISNWLWAVYRLHMLLVYYHKIMKWKFTLLYLISTRSGTHFSKDLFQGLLWSLDCSQSCISKMSSNFSREYINTKHKYILWRSALSMRHNALLPIPRAIEFYF